MKKVRGFWLKHRVTSLFRRKSHPSPPRPVSMLWKWGARLKTKAVALCSKKSGYLPVGEEADVAPSPPRTAVPKGKMAVYVGQKDGEFERVLVPVIYINHPLFGRLLREAEEEFGHHHDGGITIPCRISEFENVKTRIAAMCGGRKC